MSDPNIRRKLEKNLVAYVRAHAISHLKGFTIVEGHDNVEPELPYLVCYVSDAKPVDGLQDAQIKNATVVWHLKTEANDEERSKADARLEELDTILMQPPNDSMPYSDANKSAGALMAAVNKPASGPDARAITGFHLYDYYFADDVNSMDGTAWHDQLVHTAVCQPYDSH